MMRRFLDCSSGHPSLETWSWLDAQLADDVLRDPANASAAAIAGGKTRYGWLVHAPEAPFEGVPADLMAVLQEARSRGAEYVLFDCDAETDAAFPIRHPDFRDAPMPPEPGARHG